MTEITTIRRIEGIPTKWVTESGNDMDLSIVPDSPLSDTDPRREDLLDEYKHWYREIRRYRAQKWALIDSDDTIQRIEKEKCRRDPMYFITIYCYLYEVREEQGAGSSFVPAIPFPFQFDLVRWMQRRMRARGAGANGAVSKSRDMGATWFGVLFVLHQFLFTEPFSGKMISRREDLVDDPGNMDSMMERIAANMERLPFCMLPPGWSILAHRTRLKIKRPDNKNIINGESTSRRSGRGGRATMILIDEIMFIENIKPLLASVTQTSPHIFGISSESVEFGEEYIAYRDALREREPDAVLELDYYLHPYHDQEWLDDQRQRYGNDEAAFYREVLREAWAGISALVYPRSTQITANEIEWHHDGTASICVGFDPGWDDEAAFGIIAENYQPGRDLVMDGFEARQLPPEFYAAIICGAPDSLIHEFGASDIVEREAFRVAELFRALPQPIIYGDPAGSQMHHGGVSWYDKMILFWLEHNPRKGANGKGIPLVIQVDYLRFNTDEKQRGRRNSMMKWLPRLDFNANEQARAFLTALQRSRFDEPSARGRMSEQKTPRHDQWSHRRTCMEFAAVNLETTRQSLAVRRSDPYRGVGTRAAAPTRTIVLSDSATR